MSKLKSVFRTTLVALVTAAAIHAQAPPTAKPAEPAKPIAPSWSDVKPLLDRVSTLPAEYRADLGFAILEQMRKNIPAKSKQELLDQIFTSAPSVRYANALLYAAGNYESSAAQESNALRSTQADGLSIQTKVVELMRKDLPNQAAQKFSEIKLAPLRSSCTDPTVADLTAYYRTLETLFKDPNVQTFAGESRQAFLLDVVRDARTPQQFAPLLASLDSIDPNAGDTQVTLGFLLRNMDNATITDRELRGLWSSLYVGIQRMSSHLRGKGISNASLMIAYRGLLVRSLTAEVCAEPATSRKYIVSNFNRFPYGTDDATKELIAPLTDMDVRAKETGSAAVDPAVPSSEDLNAKIRQLAQAGNMMSLTRRSTGPPLLPEETQAIIQYALSPSIASGCSLCDFQARTRIFDSLSLFLPAGEQLRLLLTGEIDMISNNPIENQDPPAFLQSLKQLVRTGRPVPLKIKALMEDKTQQRVGLIPPPSADPSGIQTGLRRSNDPIISTYIEFEDLFKPDYQPIFVTSAPIA